MQIDLENVTWNNNLYKMDEKRTITIMKPILRREDQINTAWALVQTIKTLVINEAYEDIAINVEFDDAQSYFEFKMLVKKAFAASHINVTLFLNKVIEITDPILIQKILRQYHDSLLGGHNSLEIMKNTIKKFFEWHNMVSDIKSYVKNCDICEKNKVSRHTKNPMQITSTASRPFEKVYIDLVGEISPNSAEGHKYIFTCICDLTKFVIAVPIMDSTAKTIADVFVKHVVLRFGPPRYLVSDNATYFSAETVAQVTRLLKIKKIFSTPYHPQSNLVERYHKSLNAFIRSYVENEYTQWHTFIDYACYSHNTCHNTATGYSPFELLYAYEPSIPSEIFKRDVPTYNYDNYVNEVRSKLKVYHELAKANIEKRKFDNKKNYDKSRNKTPLNLKINDLVLIQNPAKKFKHSPPYLGPYRVAEICSPVVIKVKIGNKIKKIHTDRVKKANADYGASTPEPIISENIQIHN